jgi:hypothetical protein
MMEWRDDVLLLMSCDGRVSKDTAFSCLTRGTINDVSLGAPKDFGTPTTNGGHHGSGSMVALQGRFTAQHCFTEPNCHELITDEKFDVWRQEN